MERSEISWNHQYMQANGIRIHYVRHGKGFPIILLPGASKSTQDSSARSFLLGVGDPVIKIPWADRLEDYFTNYTSTRAEDTGSFV